MWFSHFQSSITDRQSQITYHLLHLLHPPFPPPPFHCSQQHPPATRRLPQTTRGNVGPTPHVCPPYHTIVERASAKLKILKALSGTNGRKQKETITITYKVGVCLILTYAASEDNQRRVQIIQNTAHRVATGLHKRTSSQHLHKESWTLPIEDSLCLLCRKYMASALCPSNPSNAVVTPDQTKKKLKT